MRVKRFFVRLWRKFRYSGGHDIHSPFAFDFVTKVVYNPCRYYFFDSFQWKKQDGRNALSGMAGRKTGELLFRIVERYKLSNIIVLGERHLWLSAYCTAPSPAIKLYAVESVHFEVAGNSLFTSPALILLDDVKTKEEWMELYAKMKPVLNESAVIAIPVLHDDREKKALWNEICRDDFVRVTFDLYDVGILFFEKKLYKKNYIVSF